ncbi:MAG TPA: hypothetical protein VMN39_03520 [Longimicrobiaceae bacterium]|nr:hypothetical protein [Longimicrobiaceae bacterium]
MPIKALALTALVLALAGCSSIFGPERPEVSIALYSAVGYDRLGRFEVDIGGRLFRFQADDEVSRKVDAPEAGLLSVQVRLMGTGTDTLAAAEFSQRFSEGSEHWIVGRLGLQRPLGHCIGQLIVVPLPPAADAPQADTLFLTHGSIPEGAVC